ncbi:MAG TPA: CvpA family protein [Rhizomicrobium sp.]|jgi:membrane protein required for colicin V production
MHAINGTWVDLAVIGIVAISTILAVIRGFVRETLSIFSWVVAGLAALYFGPGATTLLRGHISTPMLAPVLAYAGIFLVLLVPLSFFSHRLSERVRRSAIGTLDRSLGIPFGILRGLALVGFVYLAFSLLVPLPAQPAWVKEARLLPLIQGSRDVLLSLVPSHDRHDEAKPAQTSADNLPVRASVRRIARAANDLQKTDSPEHAAATFVDAATITGDGKR